MSNRKTKGNKLPPLQRKVVLCLAHKGPQTINEIKTNIPRLEFLLTRVCHYKPTWLAVKWLRQKRLVKKVGIKEYRGRKYPRYWLTSEGVMAALIEGANPETLLNKTRKIYPKNEILQYSLEIAPKLNPKVFKIGYSAIRSKGKLEPVDLATILFTQMQTETHIQTFKETIEILRRYPKEFRSFKEQVERMVENINRLKEMI